MCKKNSVVGKPRIGILQAGSSNDVKTRAVGNEPLVEHSLGFTKKKGQGHSQNMEEYIASKRTDMVDFQMRMSKLPFCQHTKTKLRDKGYQSLEDRQVPISLKVFKEIFDYDAGKEINPHSDGSQVRPRVATGSQKSSSSYEICSPSE